MMKQKATLSNGKGIEFVWNSDDPSMDMWTIGKLREEERNKQIEAFVCDPLLKLFMAIENKDKQSIANALELLRKGDIV